VRRTKIYSSLRLNTPFSEAFIIKARRDPHLLRAGSYFAAGDQTESIMTHIRTVLFAAAAATAFMASAQAFAQGAAPSPEAFPPYVGDTSFQPATGRIVMQSGHVKIHEGRNSAFVPYQGDYGYTDTSREGQIHAN
jgi:hypothetical protein